MNIYIYISVYIYICIYIICIYIYINNTPIKPETHVQIHISSRRGPHVSPRHRHRHFRAMAGHRQADPISGWWLVVVVYTTILYYYMENDMVIWIMMVIHIISHMCTDIWYINLYYPYDYNGSTCFYSIYYIMIGGGWWLI